MSEEEGCDSEMLVEEDAEEAAAAAGAICQVSRPVDEWTAGLPGN